MLAFGDFPLHPGRLRRSGNISVTLQSPPSVRVAPVDSTEELAHAFARTLPRSYTQRFGDKVIAGHATTAAQRGDALANVGPLDATDPSVIGMCVVAEDRAGLLSLISDSFTRTGLDVVSAVGYTRKVPDRSAEAVDFFWLARQNGVIGPLQLQEIEHVRETLLHLLAGELPPPPLYRGPGRHGETSIRFIENANGKLCTLELETADASGLLRVITAALFAQGVRINGCKLTTHNGRVLDRFTVTELDGSVISPERRLQIQVAVISALEFPSVPPPPLEERREA